MNCSSMCHAVPVVSSLYSGAVSTGTSPQPSSPLVPRRISRHECLSWRPKLVSNGKTRGSSAWRTSAHAILTSAPYLSTATSKIHRPYCAPARCAGNIGGPPPSSGCGRGCARERARPGASQDVRSDGLVPRARKIDRLVADGEVVLEHLTRCHPPAQCQLRRPGLDVTECRGHLHPHDGLVEVGRDRKSTRLAAPDSHERRGGIRPRSRGRVTGQSGLDRGIAQPPIHLQPVAGHSPVDGIGHLAIVVDVVARSRHAQLAQVKRGVEALQRIEGPHHPIEATVQRRLPLRPLEQEPDVAVLQAGPHAGHVRVEEEVTVAQSDEAVTKSHQRAVFIERTKEYTAGG